MTLDFEHELRRRLVMEDPDVLHDDYVGRATHLDGPNDDISSLHALQIAMTVHADRKNPIAATAVVRRPLKLVLDEAAVIAKFPQEEKSLRDPNEP